MMGNIALIEEELGPDSPLLELTEPTLRAIEQASELTNRMLSFARRQPFQLQVINPNKLLNGIEPLLRQALVEEIRIEYSLKAEIWPCRADQGQLEQAILNLAINARDAMPHGGQLRIETANFQLSPTNAAGLETMRPGDYVRLAISDTGVGMTEGEVNQAFEPFFTTKDVGEGSGLGLSMVYGFVKQSGGHIEISSEPGIGSTVRIYLPKALTDAPSEEKSPILPTAPAGKETILVVEDELATRTVLTRGLSAYSSCRRATALRPWRYSTG